MGFEMEDSETEQLVSNEDDVHYTVDAAIEKLGFGRFQFKLLTLAGLAWMADSMEMAILAILGPAIRCEWMLTHWHEAFLTTVVFIGMFLSTYFWGYLSDRYGRKKVLIMATLGVGYYGMLSTFSPRYEWVLFLRGMVGFSMGGVVQGTTLIVEFLPIKARGLTINISSLFWSVGTCFEIVIAMFVMPTLGWRWQLFFSSLPSFVVVILSVFLLPESVRFFVTTGQHKEAEEMLLRVSKANKEELPPGKLKPQIIAKHRGSIREMFKGEYCKTTLLLWVIWFSSHFNIYGLALLTTALFSSGYGCYGSSPIPKKEFGNCNICKELSYTDYVHFLYVLTADFASVAIVACLADTVGRKRLQAIGFGFMAFFFSLLFICTYSKTWTTVILFFIRCFAAAADIGGYIYTPEVYPTHIRGMALGSCSGISRIGCMLTPFVAQVLTHVSIHLTVATYTLVAIAGMICSLLLPIETKGRGLTEEKLR